MRRIFFAGTFAFALGTVGAVACGGGALSSNIVDASSELDATTNASQDGGPCQSQSDCTSSQFCNQPGTCSGPGVCTDIPKICPGLTDAVCGCNGVFDSNPCHLYFDEKTSIAYGGSCRDKTIRSCHSDTDCASDEVCAIDESVDCDGGAQCTGFCATTNAHAPCATSANCIVNTPTQACSRAACVDGGSFACRYCVFTSPLNCDASADCPTGQVCLEPTGCSGATCSKICVVP